MQPENEKPPLRGAGEIINGRYSVARLIGRGASGEVYAVVDQEEAGRQKKGAEGGEGKGIVLRALKYMTLGPEFASAIEHFKSEFDTMTHLNHPHIAKVYDFGWDDDLKFHFFTSELIDGFDFVTSAMRLDIEQVEELLIQSLRALEYLHGHNIFHFDIKPHNILVQDASGPSPSVKVIDFGMASACPPNKIIGTPSYIAPEIITRNNPDGRADLYSLGVVAYYTLTGLNPFKDTDKDKALRNQLTHTPLPPRELNSSIPEYLSSIIMKLLEKDPGHRYATPSDVIHDINFRSPRFYAIETPDTLLSYVPWKGPFVGRKEHISVYREWLKSVEEAGPESKLFWIRGDMGTGKSRFAEECKNIAQLLGINTLSSADVDYKFLYKLEKAKPPSVIIIDNFDKFLEQGDRDKIEFLQKHIHETSLAITSSDKEGPNEQIRKFFIDTDIHLVKGIELDNLSFKEVAEYICTITGLSVAPHWLLRRLYAFTGGNPMFLTETMKQMISRGLLFDSAGRWKETTLEDLGVDFSQLDVPDAVRELIKERLGKLPCPEREIASILSACRGPLTKDALLEITVQVIDPALDGLVQKNILAHNSRTDQYSFRDVITKRAAYLSLPLEDRRNYHDRIAQHLRSSEAKGEDITYHLQRGADDNVARKELLKEILMEGKEAALSWNVGEFLGRFGSGLDQDVFDATIRKAERLAASRRLKEAEDTYNELLNKLLADPVTPQWQFKTHISLASLLKREHKKERKLDEALAHIKKAKKLARQLNDPTASIIVENQLAGIDLQLGNHDYAIQQYIENLKKTKKLSKEEKQRITNNDLGHAYFQNGKNKDAVKILNNDVKFFSETGDKRHLCRALYTLGEAYRQLHKYDKAENIFNDIINKAKEINDIDRLCRAYNGMGSVLDDRGNFSDSVGYYERAFDLAIHLGTYETAVYIMEHIGMAYSNLGDIKKSLDTYQTALSFLERRNFPVSYRDVYLCKTHLELGELYRLKNEFDKAERHLQNSLEFSKTPQAKPYLFYIMSTQAKLAKDKGDANNAKALLKKAKELADSTREKKALKETQKYITTSVAHRLLSRIRQFSHAIFQH